MNPRDCTWSGCQCFLFNFSRAKQEEYDTKTKKKELRASIGIRQYGLRGL